MISEAIQKIEEILGIRLVEHDRKQPAPNTYTIQWGDIYSLKLENVQIETVDALRPYLPKLRRLMLHHSTVSNVSELLKLQINELNIDHVVFKKDDYDETILQGIKLTRSPYEVHINNSSFNAAAWRDFKDLRYCFVSNCTVQNIAEFCNCPKLYQLNLTEVCFGENSVNRYRNDTMENQVLLTIENCVVEQCDFFLPFAPSLSHLRIYNSQLQNIDDILQMPELPYISIDNASTIKHWLPNKNTAIQQPTELITCHFIGTEGACNLEKLAAIAPYIEVLSLKDCDCTKLTGIELFSNVNRLWFEDMEVHLHAFLPIAARIQSVEFTNASIADAEYWSHFPKVDDVESNLYDDNKKGLETLKNILPLATQLKRLNCCISTDRLKDMELITQFRNLEILDFLFLQHKIAKLVVSLPKLKKMKIGISTNRKAKLDFSKLVHIEYLKIYDAYTVQLSGFEYLTKLSCLEIQESTMDINSLPSMPNLKRLLFQINDCEVKGLSQFPNLEELKIERAQSIQLTGLHRLKVLDLSNNNTITKFDFFDDLPALEKLDLSSMFGSPEDKTVELKYLKNLSNLRALSLMETPMQTLDGIEHLQKLEYLDLYEAEVEDVRILNQLPNLKEVNLAVSRHHELEDMQAQLDKPEKGVFVCLPHLYLSIWDRVDI